MTKTVGDLTGAVEWSQMKTCLVQFRPTIGAIDSNIKRHKVFIERAALMSANLIVFPELSVTGYEPKIANELASRQNDPRFDGFQVLSNSHGLTIGIGMPIRSQDGIKIGMIFFRPQSAPQTYCKQYLHSDELPYFVAGREQIFLPIADEMIAPAICYEAMVAEHAEKAFRNGANNYVASVAKSAAGMDKATKHLSALAQKYSTTVLLSNSVGPCDNFEAYGKSSVWNRRGELIGQLGNSDEGMLFFDSVTQKTFATN